MASKKRVSPDTRQAQRAAGLKKAGAYYSGKMGGGSADTMAARGKSRVSKTVKTLASEGPKRGKASASSAKSSAAKSTSGGRGKAVPPRTRPGATTAKRPGTRSSNPVPGIVAATGVVGAAGAAARAAGRAAGRAAYRPTNTPVRSESGAIVGRFNEPSAASARVAATGRDAMGQAMPRTPRVVGGSAANGGSFITRLGRGGGRIFGR